MYSVSSNVQLPVLPEARMEIRNEMRFPQDAALPRVQVSRHCEG